MAARSGFRAPLGHPGSLPACIFVTIGATDRLDQSSKPSRGGSCSPAPPRPTRSRRHPPGSSDPATARRGVPAGRDDPGHDAPIARQLLSRSRGRRAQLASRTAVAIDGLTTELGHVKSQQQANAIAAAHSSGSAYPQPGRRMPPRSSRASKWPGRSRIRRPTPARSTSRTACSRPCRSSSRRFRPKAQPSLGAAGGRQTPLSRSWITSAINWTTAHIRREPNG